MPGAVHLGGGRGHLREPVQLAASRTVGTAGAQSGSEPPLNGCLCSGSGGGVLTASLPPLPALRPSPQDVLGWTQGQRRSDLPLQGWLLCLAMPRWLQGLDLGGWGHGLGPGGGRGAGPGPGLPGQCPEARYAHGGSGGRSRRAAGEGEAGQYRAG